MTHLIECLAGLAGSHDVLVVQDLGEDDSETVHREVT